VGAALISVGLPTTVTMLAADIALLLGLTAPAVLNVTLTTFGPDGVPNAATNSSVVSVARKQLACALPRYATHLASESNDVVMKFDPVTVIVLDAYTFDLCTDEMVGAASVRTPFEYVVRAPEPQLLNVTVTLAAEFDKTPLDSTTAI